MGFFRRNRSKDAQGSDAERARRAAEAERSALFYLQGGRLRPAEAELRRCVELAPEYAVGHGYLGVVLQRLGQLDEAEQELRIAVSLAPADEALRRTHGTILEAQGHLDRAAEAYAAAIGLDPNSALAHAALGSLLLKRGDTAAATEHLMAALQLDANDPQVLTDLAQVRQQRGDLPGAIDLLRAAVSHDPSPAQYSRLGLVLAEAGDLEAATSALSTAHEGLTGDPDLLLALARVLMRRGKDDEVQHLYERVMNDYSANRERYEADLYRLMVQHATPSPAEERTIAVQDTPTPPRATLPARPQAERKGQQPTRPVATLVLEAIARLEAALTADPGNSRLRRDLSIQYMRAGRIAEAKEQARLAEQLHAQRSQI